MQMVPDLQGFNLQRCKSDTHSVRSTLRMKLCLDKPIVN